VSVESFEAMGVEVCVGGAAPDELTRMRTLFAEWDATFSPFRADSELSRVNARTTVAVSPLFLRVVRVALRAALATGGLVSPRPRGDAFDLNGVVKSLLADEALALLRGPGFVSAGGDVASRGGTDVGLPGGGVVRVDGGLATSGTTKRGPHLLDPATGNASASRWTEVTVAAGSCLAADVAAKAAFLLDADGPGWLDARGLAGRFRAGNEIVVNRTWPAAA
jgi:FAD:protein FMN transferase